MLQIVLSGAGKHFCTGIDVNALMQGLGPAGGSSSSTEPADCQGRSRWRFRWAGVVTFGRLHTGFGRRVPWYMSMSPHFAPPSPLLLLCRSFVFVLQEAMSAFEACPVPVIAAVHGHCVGAGERKGCAAVLAALAPPAAQLPLPWLPRASCE